MKKILMILMMYFTMMAGMFAYEPNKECFEVIYLKNFDSVYISYKEGERTFFVINIKDDNKNIECSASDMFFQLKVARDIIEITNNDTYKNKAINEVPFITEENFYTISEEEYVNMFTKYINNIYKEAKAL